MHRNGGFVINDFIKEIGEELKMEEEIHSIEPGHYALDFADNIKVNISTTPMGMLFKALICPVPSSKGSLFLDKAMEANLFGRGTRGAILGLDEEANHITLCLEIPEKIPYKEFKEKLEDFVTVYDYWRSEALKWK